MTERDLTDLLRDHVRDEPPFGEGSAATVVERGRRVVRRSRMIAAVGGVAAGALAVAVGAAYLGGGGQRPGPGPERGIDPAVAEAVDSYDVMSMPRTMDEHARPVLETSVPDLGPADFVAFDDQGQRLPERYWPKASGLIVRYGLDSPHQLSVTLNHARGEAEGDPDRYCDEGLEGGFYIECSVDTTAAGDVSITTLGAMSLDWPRGRGLQRWRDQFMAVDADDIESAAPDRLWFSRDVKVVKSDTFITYVSESVQARDLATARDELVVPSDDLTAIGLDPALVMPKPPPGENGCPQWTMPTIEVSCSSAE